MSHSLRNDRGYRSQLERELSLLVTGLNALYSNVAAFIHLVQEDYNYPHDFYVNYKNVIEDIDKHYFEEIRDRMFVIVQLMNEEIWND